jgi:hypothetical protein
MKNVISFAITMKGFSKMSHEISAKIPKEKSILKWRKISGFEFSKTSGKILSRAILEDAMFVPCGESLTCAANVIFTRQD